MGEKPKLDKDGVLPEFGVTRRELQADVKASIASLDAGEGLTPDQLRGRIQARRVARTRSKKIPAAR